MSTALPVSTHADFSVDIHWDYTAHLEALPWTTFQRYAAVLYAQDAAMSVLA